jgi:drug/metabolite transporter (DMT)-like permease
MTVQTKFAHPRLENFPLPAFSDGLESSADSIQAGSEPAVWTQPSSPAGSGKIAAIAALVLALFSISLSAVLVRFSEQELTPYATSFNRFWMTVVFLGIWCGFREIRQRLPFQSIQSKKVGLDAEPRHSGNPPHPLTVSCTHACETLSKVGQPHTAMQDNASAPLHWAWIGGQLFAVGAFLAADLILWSWSLTRTSVANATLLANLTPVFTCLGGWLLWGKCFDRKLLAGMAIAVGGTVLIGVNDWHVSLLKLQGDAVALLAAVAFGIYLLCLERLQSKLSTTTLLLGSSAIAALITFPIVVFTQGAWFPSSWQGWTCIASLAVVCQICGQALLVFSLNHLASEFVAIFLLLDPILAALGGWVFFAETLNVLMWIAFAIVSFGIYLAASSDGAAKEVEQSGLDVSNIPVARSAGA